MTDQPQQPGVPGNSGAWQPVPGGGDYDPDQTMHVSFAAQIPPQPRPGEDPLGAHGPVGPAAPPDQSGADPADPATAWTIPVIRDEPDVESGEYTLGSYSPSAWDQAPSPAPPTTQSFPAGMFGQGAAAAQAAQAAQAAAAEAAQAAEAARAAARQAHVEAAHAEAVHTEAPHIEAPHTEVPHIEALHTQAPRTEAPGDFPSVYRGAGSGSGDHLTGEWPAFTGPESGGVPWLPAHAPAADAAWAGVVDDPERVEPPAAHPDDPAVAAPHTLDAAAPDAGLAAEAGTSFPTAGDPLPDPSAPYAPQPLPEAVVPEGPAPEAAGSHPDLPEGDPAAPPGAAQPLPPEASAADAQNTSDAAGALDAPETDDEAAPEPEPEPAEPTRSEHPVASYMLRVNGTDRPVTDAWLGESLLYVLRERLGLAGAKDGCEQGECGACSVQVDGRLVASCLVPAATAAGSEVRTVEGLTVDGRPSDVQRALAECGAVQCGFCIPGLAMTVHDLLEGNHHPTDLDVRQAISGNLCRCSGYRGVLDAVRQVVTERGTDEDGTPADSDPVRVPHQARTGAPEATA
ncbi:(2Fe-2S)-binding protein [Actinacidiphila acididurans]|uniref:(2Fe-2S)-binding protein n=1 Tax=Actinacidiphila acididurans TaxID=2784346 RepID=A0ABS2TZQ5_9ACTN|nr:(2Fe-2S)-binding protein [Actinacidiphila acididurans]MBM9508829.1 (2Fe-2S)-binding protein [Actinacidiphila acididurans]